MKRNIKPVKNIKKKETTPKYAFINSVKNLLSRSAIFNVDHLKDSMIEQDAPSLSSLNLNNFENETESVARKNLQIGKLTLHSCQELDDKFNRSAKIAQLPFDNENKSNIDEEGFIIYSESESGTVKSSNKRRSKINSTRKAEYRTKTSEETLNSDAEIFTQDDSSMLTSSLEFLQKQTEKEYPKRREYSPKPSANNISPREEFFKQIVEKIRNEKFSETNGKSYLGKKNLDNTARQELLEDLIILLINILIEEKKREKEVEVSNTVSVDVTTNAKYNIHRNEYVSNWKDQTNEPMNSKNRIPQLIEVKETDWNKMFIPNNIEGKRQNKEDDLSNYFEDRTKMKEKNSKQCLGNEKWKDLQYVQCHDEYKQNVGNLEDNFQLKAKEKDLNHQQPVLFSSKDYDSTFQNLIGDNVYTVSNKNFHPDFAHWNGDSSCTGDKDHFQYLSKFQVNHLSTEDNSNAVFQKLDNEMPLSDVNANAKLLSPSDVVENKEEPQSIKILSSTKVEPAQFVSIDKKPSILFPFRNFLSPIRKINKQANIAVSVNKYPEYNGNHHKLSNNSKILDTSPDFDHQQLTKIRKPYEEKWSQKQEFEEKLHSDISKSIAYPDSKHFNRFSYLKNENMKPVVFVASELHFFKQHVIYNEISENFIVNQTEAVIPIMIIIPYKLHSSSTELYFWESIQIFTINQLTPIVQKTFPQSSNKATFPRQSFAKILSKIVTKQPTLLTAEPRFTSRQKNCSPISEIMKKGIKLNCYIKDNYEDNQISSYVVVSSPKYRMKRSPLDNGKKETSSDYQTHVSFPPKINETKLNETSVGAKPKKEYHMPIIPNKKRMNLVYYSHIDDNGKRIPSQIIINKKKKPLSPLIDTESSDQTEFSSKKSILDEANCCENVSSFTEFDKEKKINDKIHYSDSFVDSKFKVNSSKSSKISKRKKSWLNPRDWFSAKDKY